MKSCLKRYLVLILLFMPMMVFASGVEDENSIKIALMVEIFITAHVSLFVLKPMSEIISKENSKKTFWTLFFVRIIILLFFDFFVTPAIAVLDFLGLFVCAFLVVPVCCLIFGKNINNNQIVNVSSAKINTVQLERQVDGIELRCVKCNALLNVANKYCTNCGTPFDGNNVMVVENSNSSIQVPQKKIITPLDFNSIYSLPEEELLETFINKELEKAGIDKSISLIPTDVLKRKKILNIIFSFLVFIFMSLIFFHFPIYTYIIGIVILIIFLILMSRYDLIKYLKKQIKARPGEKISNIIMSIKQSLETDNTSSMFVIYLLIAIILPLFLFFNPRIIYENADGGVAVRYYIFGVTNFKTVIIPETYKDKKIVALRGNTFSNMYFLESVKLPDSVVEIRGQAFKNCKSLVEVNMPKNLEYLGGGAFYNAKSVEKIELPDTLTYLGGESFYGAKSLRYIKLSKNLTEIRGNSFEYCISLESIVIPDNVTRIGGHAFYGNSLLSEVSISKNSKLTEIGSSAFRQCSNLYSITIPNQTYVNERAFKESPTIVKRFDNNGRYYK